MNWLRWRHRAEYLIFQIALCFVQCCSPRVSARLAEGLAFVVHRLLPRKWSRYAVARENLRTAFGDRYSEAEIERIVYGMWVHLFRMVTEIIQSPRKMHLHSYREIITFVDFQPTVRAMCSGRPMMLLGGHFGNWEVAISIFGLWGFPMGVVARELDNPYLNDWFRRYREFTGHRMLAKKGGYEEMLEMLQRRGNLALLCDQDAGSRGLFVDFFGTPASTFKSIALLAMEYDALIVVGYSRRLPDDFATQRWERYELGCEAVIDPRTMHADDPVREITQQYTAALERAVLKSPEQYFWVHRRWKSQPKVRQRRAKLAG
jgi:KDO2-lipid IV(A) lauroyltransferase